MKSKLKLLIIIIFSFCLFFLWNINSVFAASANISGKTSVQKGESVTITATVNAGAWNLTLTGAGQSVQLVGQTNTTGNSTASKSITFVANSNTTFTLTGEITDYSDEISRPVTKSTTIKVSEKNPTTSIPSTTTTSQNNNPSTVANTNQSNNKKSSNANLSNLGIRPNDFSGFRANKTSYSVTVPEEVETVEVYAKAQDPKSKISGIGKKKLQNGKNTATITVTAEDGTKKSYTINITRKGQEEQKQDDEEKKEDGEQGEKNGDTIEAKGLAKLELGDLKISPEFHSEIYEYTINYTGEETKLDINAVATDEEYKVEVLGNEDLKDGENIITILVSDAQANNIATYQITVNKNVTEEAGIQEEQPQQKEGETQKKIIIGCGIAIGVTILIIIVIIWRRRNRDWEEDEDDIAFYNHNNQLEDFDENMRYKGSYIPSKVENKVENRENRKVVKEKYLENYNKRDIEWEEDNFRKSKSRGKRFK